MAAALALKLYFSDKYKKSFLEIKNLQKASLLNTWTCPYYITYIKILQ
ncbi:hypothetical protein DOT_3611 [Desulfosporosinus sp. OT]|nr:hypothetical protein DOT_3611 [Desulfosporosinus sp. OT]